MSNYRLKSSMIIYELERSIGKYLINKNNALLELNTSKEILERVSQRENFDDINKIKLIIEDDNKSFITKYSIQKRRRILYKIL